MLKKTNLFLIHEPCPLNKFLKNSLSDVRSHSNDTALRGLHRFYFLKFMQCYKETQVVL